MLEHLAEQGYPVDFEALDAPFNFTISSIATYDVDVDVILKFSNRLRELIRQERFSCELKDIILHPVILNPEITSSNEAITWKRKDMAYVIRQSIGFSDWQNGSLRDKKKLLESCVVDAVGRIPEKHLAEASRGAIVKIVRAALRPKKA
jgi:hypothetical protein